MTPTILVVDDDAASLAVLTDELRARHGRDYRILSDSHRPRGAEAPGALAEAGREVALILADQWMPHMSGVELCSPLRTASTATARRGLLSSNGVTVSSAGPILRASALGHIDYYVPKPVYVPDARFHRTVTEFLDEWWRLRGRWLEVVRWWVKSGRRVRTKSGTRCTDGRVAGPASTARRLDPGAGNFSRRLVRLAQLPRSDPSSSDVSSPTRPTARSPRRWASRSIRAPASMT